MPPLIPYSPLTEFVLAEHNKGLIECNYECTFQGLFFLLIVTDTEQVFTT